jgi:hypothetical protein
VAKVPASSSDRFRSVIAQPATSQSTASETGAGLRLNMLPVVFPNEIQRDVVYSLPYTQEAWEPLRERARGGKEFHITRHLPKDLIYLWPHSGESMPVDLDLSTASTHLASSLRRASSHTPSARPSSTG